MHVGSIASMSLGDLLARKSEQARLVWNHVRAQRQIANISIERSVELFMVLEDIDMAKFDTVLALYHSTNRDAKAAGYEYPPCKKCPEA
jgi:hypothetical protein